MIMKKYGKCKLHFKMQEKLIICRDFVGDPDENKKYDLRWLSKNVFDALLSSVITNYISDFIQLRNHRKIFFVRFPSHS